MPQGHTSLGLAAPAHLLATQKMTDPTSTGEPASTEQGDLNMATNTNVTGRFIIEYCPDWSDLDSWVELTDDELDESPRFATKAEARVWLDAFFDTKTSHPSRAMYRVAAE